MSFQLEPQRVVGGRIGRATTSDLHLLKDGGIEAKPDKETTQLTIHKVLVTAVQRAPVATPRPSPRQRAARPPAEDTPSPPVTDPDCGRERRGRHQDRLRLGIHGHAALAEQRTARRH